MSIDALLDRRYHRDHYNCLHFAVEAWRCIVGDGRLVRIDSDVSRNGVSRALFEGFARVSGPTVAPSVALMHNQAGDLHIGICIERKLLHIDIGGPEFFPVSHYGHRFFNLRYYQ